MRADVLPAEAQLREDGAIALYVRPVEVGELPSPLPDHLEQAALRVVIVLVSPQMLSEPVYALGEDGYLHL